MANHILVFSAHYLPGFKAGGPIKSVAHIVEHLGSDFDFYIVTKDRDLGSDQPYDGIKTWEWIGVGKAKVMYVQASGFSSYQFSRIVREVDPCVIYLNSFFDWFFSIRFLFWRYIHRYKGSVLLAPRGEFSQGALELKSFKKKVYVKLVKYLGLLGNVRFHASSEHESADIQRVLKINDSIIYKALDLPAQIVNSHEESFTSVTRSESPMFSVVFLSRVSRKKNLDFAIFCLRDVKTPLRFDIYGPKEDKEYWAECERLFSELPSHIHVRYMGSVNSNDTAKIFSAYDLFFFPTRGENYGHVIAESLSVGTPVLISDQTPWHGLENDGAGWALPLASKTGFVEKIEYLASLPPRQRLAMREDVIQSARNRILNPQHVEDNRRMFMELCSLND